MSPSGEAPRNSRSGSKTSPDSVHTKPSWNIRLYLVYAARAIGSFCNPYVITSVFTLHGSSNSLMTQLREFDSLKVKTLCSLLDVMRPIRWLCHIAVVDCFTVAFSRFVTVSDDSKPDNRSLKFSIFISFFSWLTPSKTVHGSSGGVFFSPQDLKT